MRIENAVPVAPVDPNGPCGPVRPVGPVFPVTPVTPVLPVFGDATNRYDTYGGGRFLDTAGPDAEGNVYLDFNLAYNPPCAFTPFATCPLPTPENKLPVAMYAGEKSTGLLGHK